MSATDTSSKEPEAGSVASIGETRYDQMQRIYRGLFGNPEDPGELNALREALLTYSQQTPASEERALQILRGLNGGREPPFILDQLTTLRSLFVPERALSPIQREASTALQARRLWHELVFGNIDDLKLLWEALHGYCDPDNPEESRKRVLTLLETMVPGASWGDDQIKGLATIATQEVQFRDLAWWDTFHDVW